MQRTTTEPRYNIITGQKLIDNASSYNKLFSSNQSLQNSNKIKPSLSQIQHSYNFRRNTTLGKPKDYKQFQYSYDRYQNNNNSNRNQEINKIESDRIILPQVGKSFNRQKHSLSSSVQQSRSNIPNKVTMNHVSVPYNFINHGNQLSTAMILDKSDFNHHLNQANRKNPLTKIIDDANMYKSNFHEGYQDKVNNNIFRRKKQICAQVCNVEKGYGFGKYFRKYK